MSQPIDLNELRELFLATPESQSTRVLAIVLSVGLVAIVLWLVRRRTLREEFTPIWMGAAVAFMIVSVQPEILFALTRAVGAWTPSSTLFFLGELFLLAICLNYAVRLSRAGLQIKNLAQELALLRAEFERAGVGPRRASPSGE